MHYFCRCFNRGQNLILGIWYESLYAIFSTFRLTMCGRVGCVGDTGKCTHIFFSSSLLLSPNHWISSLFFFVKCSDITELVFWANILFACSCSSQIHNELNPMKIFSIILHEIWLCSWIVCSHNARFKSCLQLSPAQQLGGECHGREVARGRKGWRFSNSHSPCKSYLSSCILEPSFLLVIWYQN